MGGRTLCRSAVFLALVAGGLPAQNGAAAQFEEHFENGNRALKSGDWPLAEREYRAAQRLDRTWPQLHSNLGLACYFQQKYAEAERELSIALQDDSGMFVPNLFLGIIYHRRGEFRKAAPLLSKAAGLQPGAWEPHYWLGLNLANSGDYEAAAGEIQLGLKSGGTNSDGYYHLGRIYSKLAQRSTDDAARDARHGVLYDQLVLARRYGVGGIEAVAQKHLSAARNKNPGIPRVSLELGEVALGLSDWTAAASDFRTVLKAEPNNYRAHFGLTQAYLNQGDAARAVQHLRQALEIRPEFFRAVPAARIDLPKEKLQPIQAEIGRLRQDFPAETVLLSIWLGERTKDEAMVEAGIGEFARQRGRWEKSTAESPSPAGEVRLAEAADRLMKEQRFERAARAYAALLKLKPAEQPIRLRYAEALFEAGDYAGASAALREYVQSVPGDGLAHFRLSECYEELAVDALDRIAQIEPGSYRVHQLRAESMLERSDWQGAIREFRSALAIKSNDNELYYGLGRAHLKAGMVEEARAHFEKALALNPFDASTEYAIGLCYRLGKEPEKAIPYLRAAIRRDPGLLEAREQLGRALAAQQKYSEAVPELEAAGRIDSDGSVHYVLFVSYRKLQQPDKANAALKKSKELRDRNRERAQFETAGDKDAAASASSAPRPRVKSFNEVTETGDR